MRTVSLKGEVMVAEGKRLLFIYSGEGLTLEDLSDLKDNLSTSWMTAEVMFFTDEQSFRAAVGGDGWPDFVIDFTREGAFWIRELGKYPIFHAGATYPYMEESQTE